MWLQVDYRIQITGEGIKILERSWNIY